MGIEIGQNSATAIARTPANLIGGDGASKSDAAGAQESVTLSPAALEALLADKPEQHDSGFLPRQPNPTDPSTQPVPWPPKHGIGRIKHPIKFPQPHPHPPVGKPLPPIHFPPIGGKPQPGPITLPIINPPVKFPGEPPTEPGRPIVLPIINPPVKFPEGPAEPPGPRVQAE